MLIGSLQAVVSSEHETETRGCGLATVHAGDTLTCPWQSSSILSNMWKISSLGWCMVRTTVRLEPANLYKWLSSSRDEVASRPEVGSSRKIRLG